MIFCSVVMVSSNRRGGALRNPDQLRAPPRLAIRPGGTRHRCQIKFSLMQLIEPDMQIARIRLSDKTSRLHPRRVAPKRGEAYESEVPVEVRERIGSAPTSPDLVLGA